MRRLARPYATVTAFAVLALPLIVSGCARSEKSEAAAKLAARITACDLFPEEVAARVSHQAVARMTSTLEDAGKPDPAQCVYNSGTLEQPRILSLLVRTFNDRESAARVEADSLVYLARLAGRPVLHIRDVGDGAVWAGGKVQQLHVRRGPVQLLITVQSPDGSEQLAESREVAAEALTRLDAILSSPEKAGPGAPSAPASAPPAKN